MGEVIAEIDKTTTPQLTTEGFLLEYARMAQVASILAAAMFVMALLEAVVQGSWAVLGKAVFISVPLAFVGTSIAFVLVQVMGPARPAGVPEDVRGAGGGVHQHAAAVPGTPLTGILLLHGSGMPHQTQQRDQVGVRVVAMKLVGREAAARRAQVAATLPRPPRPHRIA
jgi:hypothetical protein